MKVHSFSKYLAKYIANEDLKLKAVAGQLGISYRHLRNLLDGKNEPTLEVVERVQKLIGVEFLVKEIRDQKKKKGK